MTDRGHDHFRDLTAAYVLGSLDAEDRAGLELHLGSCEQCRDDVVAFAPLPALLSRLDVADLGTDVAPDAGERLVAAVHDELRAVDRNRRRWRAAAGGAAAAAVVLGLVVVLDADGGSGRDGIALEVEAASAGPTAEVLADERAWGTYVHVSAEDLPEHDQYELWVVDTSGAWHAAGSWARTPDGSADLGASTPLTLPEIDRVVITSADRTEEILVAR